MMWLLAVAMLVVIIGLTVWGLRHLSKSLDGY